MTATSGHLASPAGALVAGIRAIGAEFVVLVPDSTAKSAIGELAALPDVRTLMVTKEEEGVGLVCGLVLAGRRVVMLIQDTGFGNMITALGTFAQPYNVPMLVIAARTGGVGEINSAVGGYATRLPDLLKAAGLRVETLDLRTPIEEWPQTISGLHAFASVSHQPVALLVDLKHVRSVA